MRLKNGGAFDVDDDEQLFILLIILISNVVATKVN